MKHLVWSLSAKQDIEAIRDYLGVDAAYEFPQIAERIVQAAQILSSSPYVGPVIGLNGERKWKVRGLPYLIIYRPRKSGTRILRIRHGNENWREVLL